MFFFHISRQKYFQGLESVGTLVGKEANVSKSSADLLFSAVAADHPGGQFHGMVLVFIVAHVTGVHAATAGKPGTATRSLSSPPLCTLASHDVAAALPQPAVTLFEMPAGSLLWQRLPLLHSRVPHLIVDSRRVGTCTHTDTLLILPSLQAGASHARPVSDR